MKSVYRWDWIVASNGCDLYIYNFFCFTHKIAHPGEFCHCSSHCVYALTLLPLSGVGRSCLCRILRRNQRCIVSLCVCKTFLLSYLLNLLELCKTFAGGTEGLTDQKARAPHFSICRVRTQSQLSAYDDAIFYFFIFFC